MFATSISSQFGVDSEGIDESIAESVGLVESKAFISSPETPLFSHHGFPGAVQEARDCETAIFFHAEDDSLESHASMGADANITEPAVGHSRASKALLFRGELSVEHYTTQSMLQWLTCASDE